MAVIRFNSLVQFLGQLTEEEELDEDEDRYVDGMYAGVLRRCCGFEK